MSLREPSLDDFVEGERDDSRREFPDQLPEFEVALILEDGSDGGRHGFPEQLPEFEVALIRTPSWAAGYDDPVIVAAQGDRHHEPDLTASQPAPECWYANKDVEWTVRERAFEDGWSDCCEVCPEVDDVE